MSDNLVLELLRGIRGDTGVIAAGIGDMKYRLTAIEIGMAGVRRDIAGLLEQQVMSTVRSDTFGDSVHRIDCRWT